MKRAWLVGILTALLLAILSFEYLATPPGNPAPRDPRRRGDPMQAPLPGRQPAGSTEAADRAPLEAGVVSETAPGDLIVQLVFEGTTKGAPGVGVTVIPQDGRSILLGLRQEITDDRGRAVFDLLAPGAVEIAVGIKASARAEILPGSQANVRMEVPRGIRVEGEVIGPGGEPVANAQVLCWDRVPGIFSELPVPVAVTDRLGRFTIDTFLRTGLLSATAPGHLPSPRYSLRIAEGEPRERFSQPPPVDPLPAAEITISLRIEMGSQPGLVTGLVVTEDGTPVEHARISTTPPPSRFFRDDAGNLAENDQPAVRFTGDDGRFSLQVASGSGLTVQAAGLAPHRQAVDVTPGEQREIRIVLRESPGIHGRVRGTDGKPLAGATVGASMEMGLSTTVRTAADGSYHLDAVLVGSPIRVYATDPDHLIQNATLQVEPEGHTEWNPELEPLARLRGRVVDEVGRPLTGWSLEISPPAQPIRSPYVPVRTETADDGGFDVGVLEGRPYVPELREPGQWIQVDLSRLGELYGNQPDLLIVVDSGMRATSFLRGVLRDDAGQPLEGVSLQLYDGPLTARLDVQTDASGRFRIGPIASRHYRLQASGSRRDLPRMDLIEFDLDPRQDLDLGELTIGTQGTLVYSLRGSQGEPIAGPLNGFLYSDLSSQETFLSLDTKGDGRVTVPAGDYVLSVHAMGHMGISRRVTVTPGQEVTINVQLTAGDSVRLVPVLPEASGVEDGEHFEIRSLHPNGDWTSYLEGVVVEGKVYTDLTDAAGKHGRYPLSSVLVPGSYTLELTSESGKVFTGGFTVLEGRDPEKILTVHCLAK